MADPVEGVGAPSPEPVASGGGDPAPASEPAVTSTEPTFDWDKWDGKDDVVPEPFRPVVARVRSLADATWQAKMTEAQQRIAAAEAKAAEDKDFFDLFKIGDEHPLIRDLRAQIEAEKGRGSEWETQRTTLETQVADLNYQLDEALAYRAQIEARASIEKFPQVYANPDARKVIGDLIDKGLDLDDAVTVAAARLGIGLQPAAALNPTAEVTPGATGRPNTGTVPKGRPSSLNAAVDDTVSDLFNNVSPLRRRA